MSENIDIEPAATLLLLRDSYEGPQVLMQQRSHNAAFVGGAWVFPGGKLDLEDNDERWGPLLGEFDEQQAYQKLDLGNASSPYNLNQIHPSEADIKSPVKASAYWMAALREAFEEAGLLLTKPCVDQASRDRWREQLLKGDRDWLSLIQDESLELDVAQIHYLSRWITPPNNTRRYDTRFFIALAPEDQEPSHEDFEAIETRWYTPEQALSAFEAGSITLIFPTVITLKAMCGYDNSETLLANVLSHFNPA